MLQGNRSKLSASQLRDAVCPRTEIPSCPQELTADAKKEWKRITSELFEQGLVTKLDRSMLAIYCQAYADWLLARRKLSENNERYVETTPSGYRQQGVWLQVANRAAEQLRQFGVEFGLSPSARRNVRSAQLDLFDDETNSEKSPARFFG
ncbi:phage terminase small subunit P27 family [Plasticicumulans acidivorans]|uniref:phage terminase small subunit P27 family n=1 Tax=Plasticicumulans acidivorans TaxID=886464 RepID=UPI00147323F6|nr:phage terminase small subunit P27 family [Plasticicumulans acidivorans]